MSKKRALLAVSFALPLAILATGGASADNALLPKHYVTGDDVAISRSVISDLALPSPAADASVDEPVSVRTDISAGRDSFSDARILGDDILAEVGSQNDEEEVKSDASAYRATAFGDGALGHSSGLSGLDGLGNAPAGQAPVLPASAIAVLESLGLIEPVR